MKEKKDMIAEIMEIEWDMFQHVQNIGGRASCQDDWETFEIMRLSQYENWTDEMLRLYLEHLRQSQQDGRNLIAEKYGRMMAFTEPEYYKEEIEPNIPALSETARKLIEEIVQILIPWEIDFCRRYPKLGRAGRPILSAGDASGFTSMETYARGELATYPDNLLQEYFDYLQELRETGKSISVLDREVMTKLYGYASIQDAEDSL